ncbi:MAG: hypothetical protein NTX17_06085 [Candidatus Eisenbacteria bacterium]|nr:hypothetical protein [Candidatus Eisenbacteria bacterium]
MTRFLRRSPPPRSGWSTFPSQRKNALKRVLSFAVAFLLAFLFAWENIYMDQLLSDLQKQRNAVENLRAQVTETRAVIQEKMMLALSDTDASSIGLGAADVEQIVLLSESSGLFAGRQYVPARLSSLEQVQRRIFDFFVTTALARVQSPEQP